MEQVVTELQQELFTLRAQVAAESGLADAVSLSDVKALGRPKEFTGREEDFQEWSKKTEAFFAGVIKESEMMLEWGAEQATEITTTAIELEFLPTDTNEDRGVQNLEFVSQQMHTALMALTSYEANDTVANSRKNPLEAWRADCRSDMIRRQEEGNETFCARSFLLDGGLFWNWESYVSRYEKKMKDKLDDEIKLAGLESWCRRSLRSI